MEMRQAGPKLAPRARGTPPGYRLKSDSDPSETDKKGRRWHTILVPILMPFDRRRHLGIARRAAQMQVRISDPAELFPDRRGQCLRTTANGQSPGRQGR